MFARLTNQWRKRAATLAVALYALTLVGPTAAFAFSSSAAAAHCLTVIADHHRSVTPQSHDKHDGHDHATAAHEDANQAASASGSNDQTAPADCCGLFCVSAATPTVFDVLDAHLFALSQVAMPTATSLLGHDSGGIDRPPRNLSAI
ncbi:hypothetical protein [Pseudolabrys sp. FHR47]|uniref:hypothetical protein n=1 Tax=Pseudolabrys sp. FHR47 TaxID=2562284 RepID=UPI0010BE7E23|nr:hypothetical protein [Pseudolabrys sp. FHR47]